MMHLVAGLPYTTGDGWRAIELPYLPKSANLLIVLPDLGQTVRKAMEGAAAPDPYAGPRQSFTAEVRHHHVGPAVRFVARWG